MFDVDAMILAPMMGAGVFGDNVRPLYQPQGGGAAFYIDGVFDNPFLNVNLDNDGAPGFVTANPVLGVRLSQYPSGTSPTSSDRVTISVRGILMIYIVNEVQPDGAGWAELQLTVQGPA